MRPDLHERIEITYVVSGPPEEPDVNCYRAALVDEDEVDVEEAYGDTPEHALAVLTRLLAPPGQTA